MTSPDTRRKRLVVDKKFQVGMSLHIVGMVYFYLVLFALLANFKALKAVITGGASEEAYIEAVSRLQIFVQVFVVPLAFTFVCMCLHGVIFSHRLAGPIYRFKESLRRIRGGNLATHVQIRDNDYFQDLCDEVNAMTERLRSDLLEFRTLSGELAVEGESLADSGDLPEEARKRMLKVANASTKLRQFFESYTLDKPEASEPGTAAESEEPVAVEA